MNSILKKAIMAITGLLMVLFLIGHLGGNLLLFLGADWFDGYAKHIEELGPLLYIAEAGLILICGVHVILAAQLSVENQAARGSTGYKKEDNRSSWTSRYMIYSGVAVLVFIIIHVAMFKFGDRPVVDGKPSLFALVVDRFKDPYIAWWYVAAMILLCFHLIHAIHSSLQTLGVIKPKHFNLARGIGIALGVVLSLGFASLPIYFVLTQPEIQIRGPVQREEPAPHHQDDLDLSGQPFNPRPLHGEPDGNAETEPASAPSPERARG